VTPLGGNAVRTSVAAVRDLLDRVPDGGVVVPVMACSVTGVAQHLVSCLAWYAHDLVAGPGEVSAADLAARPEAPLGVVAGSMCAWGEVLARTVDAAAPADRGWHPHGVADPSGFAAIGCAELLVHGTDVAQALGLPWSPPADIAAAVLLRLFPEVTDLPDGLRGLLWATGRIDLPGRPHRTNWRYAMTPAGESG
jgi:hypothetical protein